MQEYTERSETVFDYKKVFVYIVIGLLVVGSIYSLFSGDTGKDVQNIRNTANDARAELSGAKEQSGAIGEAVRDVRTELRESITDVQRINGTVEKARDEAATGRQQIGTGREELSRIKSILAENDRIYQQVRATGN
jgi:predicted  nucleic acid-binding Zn-ribbon protein